MRTGSNEASLPSLCPPGPLPERSGAEAVTLGYPGPEPYEVVANTSSVSQTIRSEKNASQKPMCQHAATWPGANTKALVDLWEEANKVHDFGTQKRNAQQYNGIPQKLLDDNGINRTRT
ncbi:unnamed protein product [Caretta caretta]